MMKNILNGIKLTLKMIKDGHFAAATKKVTSNICYCFRKSRMHKNPAKYCSLDTVVVNISDICTLKCKNCMTLMQYIPEPKHFDISKACDDVDALMKHVDYVKLINIVGGEPFLVEKLPFVIDRVARHKGKYSELQVVTNGTLIPSSETLSSMKKHKATLMISNYGDLSTKKDELISLCKQHNIRYCVMPSKWTAICQPVDAKTRNPEQIRAVFERCTVHCSQLLQGRFYRCPFLARGYELGMYPVSPDFSIAQAGSIDLHSKRISRQDIYDCIVSKDIAPIGCGYCSGHDNTLPLVPVAEQIRKPIPYEKVKPEDSLFYA